MRRVTEFSVCFGQLRHGSECFGVVRLELSIIRGLKLQPSQPARPGEERPMRCVGDPQP